MPDISHLLFFLFAVYFWLAWMIAIPCIAIARKRSGIVWFVLALLFTPLVAWMWLIACPPRERKTPVFPRVPSQ